MVALPIASVYVDAAQPNKGTVRNYFNQRTIIIAATKAELRSWTTGGDAPVVWVKENNSEYVYVSSDVSTADNNDTVIVTADSNRYYRRQFMNWEGAWSAVPAYQIGDTVENDGSSYICILAHTNIEPGVTSGWATYWGLIASKGTDGQGLSRKGDWSSVTEYVDNDVVLAADGNQYIAIDTSTNKEPAVHVDWALYWELFLEKGADGTTINPKGNWDSGTTYNPDDLVVRNKNSYICTTVNLNQDPSADVGVSGVGTYWTLFASGGTDGTGTGDVVGPASATDGGFAKFDGATGKLLKNSAAVVAIADGGTGAATAAAAFAALKQNATVSATGVVELAEDTEAGAQTATDKVLTPKNLALAESSVASASTTDLGAVTSDKVQITGTTTITSFGTIAAGVRKHVRFAGALLLTHNATSLILPGGANIRTAAGDTALVFSEGAGNWRVVSYQRANGQVVGLTALVAEGRLTLESGVPVSTTDQTAKTTIYYTPFVGNKIALYDGSAKWNTYTFTELSGSLALMTANLPYDIFVLESGGTPSLAAVAWSTATARATALTTQDGVLVQSGTPTRRYVGTICITGTTGQCEDSLTKRLVWNEYNALTRPLRLPITTDSWTYSTAAWRQVQASTAYQFDVVCGRDIRPIMVEHRAYAFTSTATVRSVRAGVGLDSTTAISHFAETINITNTIGNNAKGLFNGYVGIGRHYLALLEYGGGADTQTWLGDNATPTTLQNGAFGTWEC